MLSWVLYSRTTTGLSVVNSTVPASTLRSPSAPSDQLGKGSASVAIYPKLFQPLSLRDVYGTSDRDSSSRSQQSLRSRTASARRRIRGRRRSPSASRSPVAGVSSMYAADSSSAGWSLPGRVPFAGVKNWYAACVVSKACVPFGKYRSHTTQYDPTYCAWLLGAHCHALHQARSFRRRQSIISSIFSIGDYHRRRC